MPKLTDYVREGFKRRRRPWDRVDLPEWWNIMVWVGLAAVIAILAFGAVFGPGGGDASGGAAAPAQPYPVQTLHPNVPVPSGSRTPTAPPGGAPSGTSDDFGATDPAQVPVTGGGGMAVVPAGARNVAAAAAKAEATGNWAGIPCIGRRPSVRHRTPKGRVIGKFTVTDPSVTGNSQYVFSATITHGLAARRFLVRIAVEHGPSGYAIRV